jgi:hypothetical protein
MRDAGYLYIIRTLAAPKTLLFPDSLYENCTASRLIASFVSGMSVSYTPRSADAPEIAFQVF